jgi:acetyl-CoA acetyltransferase
MRDVAVVGFVQSPSLRREPNRNEVEILVPVIAELKKSVGIANDQIDFVCSGSSDYLAGQSFAFVAGLDAVGAWPPVSESHVEMDGAWALYEAWVKLQLGEAKTALVYGYGKSSPGSLRDVLATQLDPYAAGPLKPDAFGIAGLQARCMLDAGDVTEADLAAIASRSLAAAEANPLAIRKGRRSADELLAEPYLHDPLRAHDVPARADGGAAVILATREVAERVCEHPAWIAGIDHRMDMHHFGARDPRRAPSAELAGKAAGATGDKVDLAELDAPFTHQEALLVRELGLDAAATTINPSGGSLCGHVMMGAGLTRIGEAAARIHRGEADRALAHATSGPWLQQNLVTILEGA